VTPTTTRGTPASILSLVESRFRGAIAASLDAFFLCESVRNDAGDIVDFRIVELNERGEAFLSRERGDLLGRLVCDILPSVRESGLLEQFVRVVANGESFEDELRFQDESGEHRWVRHQIVRVEDGIAITSRDITKRKQVEASLLESESRFRHLVESASDGIYRIDSRGVFTYANPVASHLLGCNDENGIVGHIYLEFVRRDYHEQGIALYKKQVMERIPVTYWEFPAISLDGRELWIGQNVHVEQRNGQVVSLFAVARDITERKTAELALRESEERHRFLSEHSTDMLSRQSPDGMILYASPVSLTLLGYSSEELVGTSVFEACHPDELEAVRAASARLLGHKGIETLTYRIRRRDGHYIWFETTSQAVTDPKSGLVEEVLCVSRDVTERRRMEEDLRQAQKMEAVGQLAGGVAHDFNNLLTAIRGFSDLLARSVEPDDPRRKDIGEILKATERAAALTRQLLAFSKRQVLRLEPLNVNGVVEDMTKIVRRLLGESVSVETRLESHIWTVRAR
jgi:two-component system cell cycle sensor histidine kinase/response regulator CckA